MDGIQTAGLLNGSFGNHDALEVQGEAMVELGATARAQINLAKLQKLCGNSCKQASALSGAISKGPTVAAATAPKTPVKSN